MAAQATTDSLAWSASTDEVQAMDAAPNAELEWSQPVEPASQDEVEVSAEHPDHVQAETSYAPDEPGEPVGVEPAVVIIGGAAVGEAVSKKEVY